MRSAGDHTIKIGERGSARSPRAIDKARSSLSRLQRRFTPRGRPHRGPKPPALLPHCEALLATFIKAVLSARTREMSSGNSTIPIAPTAKSRSRQEKKIIGGQGGGQPIIHTWTLSRSSTIQLLDRHACIKKAPSRSPGRGNHSRLPRGCRLFLGGCFRCFSAIGLGPVVSLN